MRYLPNTAQNQRAMLDALGAAGVEDLLVRIPAKARLSRPLALPPALAEADLVRHMRALATRNADADTTVCFLGAGAYDHYVPSPINHLVLRGEFFTAYTPYQPEASQGTLRTIYEYQTMIAELTGMDVANASLYDGASSLAEAALMAYSINGRAEIALAGGLNPLYRRVVETYVEGPGLKLREVPSPDGVIDLEAARRVVGAGLGQAQAEHHRGGQGKRPHPAHVTPPCLWFAREPAGAEKVAAWAPMPAPSPA